MPFPPGGQSGSRVKNRNRPRALTPAEGSRPSYSDPLRCPRSAGRPHKRSIQLPRPYSEIGQRCFDVAQAHVNAELGSEVTFTLAGVCRPGRIAYLIDHTLQVRAHLFRNLTHRDVSDGLHGSDGINCGNFNTTVLLLLQNNVAG